MHASIPWPNLKRGIVAILRGVKPTEIDPISEAIIDAGITAIEVPLNSPDAFVSIKRLAERMPPECLVGAGTVLTPDDVDRLNDAGGKLLVSPNIDADVMNRAARYGLVTMPGVFTATEALLAIKLGASALKFFPASALQPSGIKGIRAILPPDTVVGAVGGIAEGDFQNYRAAGISVFGLGTSLYQPGFSADEVGRRASAAVKAWDALA